MSRALANALSRLAFPLGAARHVHPLLGFVGVAAGGTTSAGSAVPHTHEIASVTSFDIPVGPTHAHVLFAVTGPALTPAAAGAAVPALCAGQAPPIAATGVPPTAAISAAINTPALAASTAAADACQTAAVAGAAAQPVAAGQVPETFSLVSPLLAQLSATNPPLALALAGMFPNIAAALAAGAVAPAVGGGVCGAVAPAFTPSVTGVLPGAVAAVPQAQALPFPVVGALSSLLLPSATTAPLGIAPLPAALPQVQSFPLTTAVLGGIPQAAGVPCALLPQALPVTAGIPGATVAGATSALGGLAAALAQAQACSGVAAGPAAAFPQVQPLPASAGVLQGFLPQAPLCSGSSAAVGAGVAAEQLQAVVANPPEVAAAWVPADPVMAESLDVPAAAELSGTADSTAPCPAPEVMRPIRRLPVPESLIRQGSTVVARESGVVISQGSY